MSHKFLFNTSFHLLLNSIDQELAIEMQKKGCPCCGNKLHQANYPRSPVGILSSLRHYYGTRLSFCCDVCRKRVTTQSVRFFGRHWHPGPLLIFISVLAVGINERRLAQVKYHFGIIVNESTWKRWRRWWRNSFEFDSRLLLSVILAGDQRLNDKLRRDELIPLGSRIRARFNTEYASTEQLMQSLQYLLTHAGNPRLMTPELMQILCDHAIGNYRALCIMASELLASAAQQEKMQLDEKLYLECFAVPAPARKQKHSSAGGAHG